MADDTLDMHTYDAFYVDTNATFMQGTSHSPSWVSGDFLDAILGAEVIPAECVICISRHPMSLEQA